MKEPSRGPESEGVVIVDQYFTTKSYEVPVVGDGTVTRVVLHTTDGEQTVLATTDVPLTIQVPAWVNTATPRSAAAPAVGDGDYIEILDYAKGTIEFEANSWIKDGNSVLMFEDSRLGDFDYNDLVLYVRHSIAGNNNPGNPAKITFWIKPIAMGGFNKIAFGWEDGNGEHMLTNDVRQDFFFGEPDFINTYTFKDRYDAIPVVDEPGSNTAGQCNGNTYTICRDRSLMTNYDKKDEYEIVGGYFKFDPVPTTCSSASNDTKMIKWFIKTSGFKFYVSSIDKGAPEGTFPYGLAIANAAYHPQERVNIWDAYPGFKSWIETGTPVNWSGNRVKDLCYEKHVNYARW